MRAYAKELGFSQFVPVICSVVFKDSPAVAAYYQAHPGEIPVTRQARYDKLKHFKPECRFKPEMSAAFGVCTACVAHHAVSVVKAAIRVAQGKQYLDDVLSAHYLTLEVA